MPIDPKLAQWADTEIKRKNFPNAAEKLQMGLAKCHDDLEARQKLRAVARKNKVDNPVKGLGKVKQSTKIGKLKAVLLTKKKPEDILVEGEKVLFEDPNDISVIEQMAGAASQLELYDLAKWLLEDAVKLDSSVKSVWVALGMLYYKKLNQPLDAKPCFEKVLQIDNKDGEIIKLLRTIEAGAVMGETGDGTSSDRVRDNIKDDKATIRREVESKMIRNADDARKHVAYLLEDLEADPKNSKIMEKIADRYRQGELFKESIEYLEKALELESSNDSIRMRIGQTKLDRASSQRDKIYIKFKKDSNNEELKQLYKKATLVELKMGLDVYKGWVESHPTDLRMKFQYGEYLFKAKKYKEALSMFQKAAGDPKVSDAANELLGRCFLKLDKAKMALKPIDSCLSKAGEGTDRWKDMLYLKAECLTALDEKDEAQTLYEKIYEIDIDYKDVADLI